MSAPCLHAPGHWAANIYIDKSYEERYILNTLESIISSNVSNKLSAPPKSTRPNTKPRTLAQGIVDLVQASALSNQQRLLVSPHVQHYPLVCDARPSRLNLPAHALIGGSFTRSVASIYSPWSNMNPAMVHSPVST